MKKYDYVAADVETANSDRSSICQIGLAFFKNGELINTYMSYVNPETYFDSFNEELHGISLKIVQKAPKVGEIFTELKTRLSGEVIAHHTPFNRVALSQMAKEHNIDPLPCTWLDTSKIARLLFSKINENRYSLGFLCEKFNLENLSPHDALSDAIALGKILSVIIKKKGFDLNSCLSYSNANSTSISANDYRFKELSHSKPNENGILYGNVIVFTGALSLSRIEAATIAFELGCDVDDGVTKKTTILVVGNQDNNRLAGYTKSSKHRKAEDLISQGQKIEIIGEQDFKLLVGIEP